MLVALPLATLACCLVLRWAPIHPAVAWTLLSVLLVASVLLAVTEPAWLGESRGTILAAGALAGLAGLAGLGGGVIVASLRRSPPDA